MKELEKLNNHIKLLKKYMGNPAGYERYFHNNNRVISELRIIHSYSLSILSVFKDILNLAFHKLLTKYGSSPYESDINDYLEYIKDLINIESVGEKEIGAGQIFLGIKQKLKQAGQSFRNKDYPGLFSSLHTATELTIKNKLDIPLSIGEIKIGRVIGVCIKRKVFIGKETMLKDIDLNICQIDNKIKHSGYNPSSEESSKALLIAEQSLSLLEKSSPNLDDNIRGEISDLLI